MKFYLFTSLVVHNKGATYAQNSVSTAHPFVGKSQLNKIVSDNWESQSAKVWLEGEKPHIIGEPVILSCIELTEEQYDYYNNN